MGINIDEVEAPAPDVGGDRNPNNPDTYDPGDDNGNSNVQV